MTPEQRSERASRAGKKSQSVATWVTNIVRHADDLSAEDLAELRAIVGPVTVPDVYGEGVRAGARMALDRIIRLATEVVSA